MIPATAEPRSHLLDRVVRNHAQLVVDPYDRGTLFQDAAETTPAAANLDPVGAARGGAHSLAQSVDLAARPEFRDGGGRRALGYSGGAGGRGDRRSRWRGSCGPI